MLLPEPGKFGAGNVTIYNSGFCGFTRQENMNSHNVTNTNTTASNNDSSSSLRHGDRVSMIGKPSKCKNALKHFLCGDKPAPPEPQAGDVSLNNQFQNTGAHDITDIRHDEAISDPPPTTNFNMHSEPFPLGTHNTPFKSRIPPPSSPFTNERRFEQLNHFPVPTSSSSLCDRMPRFKSNNPFKQFLLGLQSPSSPKTPFDSDTKEPGPSSSAPAVCNISKSPAAAPWYEQQDWGRFFDSVSQDCLENEQEGDEDPLDERILCCPTCGCLLAHAQKHDALARYRDSLPPQHSMDLFRVPAIRDASNSSIVSYALPSFYAPLFTARRPCSTYNVSPTSLAQPYTFAAERLSTRTTVSHPHMSQCLHAARGLSSPLTTTSCPLRLTSRLGASDTITCARDSRHGVDFPAFGQCASSYCPCSTHPTGRYTPHIV